MSHIKDRIAYITLYHGSDHIIEKPVFGEGKSYNDYGRGFYCTEHVELAKEWACATGVDGYANRYQLAMTDETYVIDIIRNNWKNGQGI